MALTSAIMSLFGGGDKTPPTPATPSPAAPAVQQTQTAVAATNPTVPSPATPASTGSVAAIPPAGTGDQSPLVQFNELWKTDPNPTNQPTAPTLSPGFAMDPGRILEQARKIDFTTGIPRDLLEKATSGDMAAMIQVINQASQFGFSTALSASGELIQNSMVKAQGTLQDQILPGAFRNEAINQALSASNPVFADPAVAPMMSMLKQQLAIKYPTAAPSEVAALATQYLSGMSDRIVTAQGGRVMTKQQQQQQDGGYGQRSETNWENFFELPGATG